LTANDRERLIVITSPVACQHVDNFQPLREHGMVVQVAPELGGQTDEDSFASGLKNAWGVIAGTERYTRPLLARLPRLRLIARMGAGVDSIDVDAARTQGIAVISAPGLNATAVADHTMGLILACARRIPWLDDQVRSGRWRPVDPLLELGDLTVGVIGLGAIGQALVRRLSGFGCTLLATDPHADVSFCREWSVGLVDLDKLLHLADIVTIHVPLDDSTSHLLDKAKLLRMKRGAILINTSRAGVVDTSALLRALETHRLAACALDVFDTEPISRSDPFLGRADVILTPHVAGNSSGGSARMAEFITNEILRVASPL
jgi:D-3-phosphoglycerate dehydrogenase